MKIRLTVRNPACLSRTEEAPSPFQLPQADLKWDLDEKYPQSKSVEINVVGFSPRTEELRFQSGPCLWDNETTGVYCPYTASGISLSCIFCLPPPLPMISVRVWWLLFFNFVPWCNYKDFNILMNMCHQHNEFTVWRHLMYKK